MEQKDEADPVGKILIMGDPDQSGEKSAPSPQEQAADSLLQASAQIQTEQEYVIHCQVEMPYIRGMRRTTMAYHLVQYFREVIERAFQMLDEKLGVQFECNPLKVIPLWSPKERPCHYLVELTLHEHAFLNLEFMRSALDGFKAVFLLLPEVLESAWNELKKDHPICRESTLEVCRDHYDVRIKLLPPDSCSEPLSPQT